MIHKALKLMGNYENMNEWKVEKGIKIAFGIHTHKKM